MKGHESPAAKSRKTFQTIKGENGEVTQREVEETDSGLMKMIMSGTSNTDTSDYETEDDFHRDQHIKACMGSVDDDSNTQVRTRRVKNGRFQSGVKGGIKAVEQTESTDGQNYEQSPSSRYHVVATSSSSAKILNAPSGVKGRSSSNTNRRVARKRVSQSKSIESAAPVRNFDRCLEPVRVGQCRGAIPRYHYNSATGMCQEFLFGGCQGNGNNFLTSDSCMDNCLAIGSRRIVVEPVYPITQQKILSQRKTGVKGGDIETAESRISKSRTSSRTSIVNMAKVIKITDSLFADLDEVEPVAPRQFSRQTKSN